MRFYGWQKVSLQDYPGKVSTILFTKGCNFRCGFCHNPELVYPESDEDPIPMETVLEYLRRRHKMLDAVVLLGGEPTIQPSIIEFAREVKELGLELKLDTNGSLPDVLNQLLEEGLVDYVAMDYKFPLERYPELTNTSVPPEQIGRSRDILAASSCEHEFRITLIEELFTPDVIEQMAKELSGVRQVGLQPFRNDVVLDEHYKQYANTRSSFIEQAKNIFRQVAPETEVIAHEAY